MPITVNQAECIGCGACAAICPQSFTMNAEGKSEIISQDLNGCARQAAEACPVQVINVD